MQLRMEDKYSAALSHIETYWESVTYHITETNGIQLGLPHPFVAPCHTPVFEGQQFYWDSYFTIIGLVVTGRETLAKGMIDNLIHLFTRYGIMPMRNRLYNLGGSQPPFLTQMIREVAPYVSDDAWEAHAYEIAAQELATYWKSEGIPEHHLAHNGLSRYCDHYVTHATAEHESGQDMTSRFSDNCLHYLPVDLNSFLYRYEKDLEEYYARTGDNTKAKEYQEMAKQRQRAMQCMWNEEEGFFFDYDYIHQAQSTFFTLAGFTALWSGLATQEQAQRAAQHLYQFEHSGGLAMTQDSGLSSEFRQWDYPNGWPNFHWLVIQGLKRYGLHEDAQRITKKWLDLNNEVFEKTGKMWEKYDVLSRDKGVSGRYVTQEGFGWTNAVFARLHHDTTKDL